MSGSCVLFHFPFQPASRAARLALGEARIEWTDTPVRPWEDDCPVNDFNPSGLPPVIQTMDRGRPLVLCVRETPFHLGHLRLLVQAAEMGAVIMPPVPAFYHRPKSLDDVINQTVNRVIDQFDISLPQDLFSRWQGA